MTMRSKFLVPLPLRAKTPHASYRYSRYRWHTRLVSEPMEGYLTDLSGRL